jgi:protein phosphatase
MVDEPFIERTVAHAASLEEAGGALIDAANDAGGRDNITVILVRLEDVAGGRAAQSTDQATAVGADALRTSDVQAAVEADRRRAPSASVATMESADSKPPTRRLEPVRPTSTAASPRRQRARWMRRTLVALAVLAVVGVPVGAGVYAAIKAVYFVGTDSQGFVTIYRGVPYELPLGIDLYERNYTSGVPVSLVPAARRKAILDQQMRSRDRAYGVVRDLERGRGSAR